MAKKSPAKKATKRVKAKSPKVSITKDSAGQWRFSVIAANGEILCQSEAYTSKSNANRGVGDLITALELL